MGTEVIVPGVAHVATVFAMTVFLWRVFGKRFDAIDARQEEFDGKLVRMESKFDGKFERMESKFDGKFERMESKFGDRFDTVDGRLGAIEVGMGKLEGQFDGLRDRFGTLESRFDTMEVKVDGLAADHQRLTRELGEFRGEMHGRFGTLVPQSADEA